MDPPPCPNEPWTAARSQGFQQDDAHVPEPRLPSGGRVQGCTPREPVLAPGEVPLDRSCPELWTAEVRGRSPPAPVSRASWILLCPAWKPYCWAGAASPRPRWADVPISAGHRARQGMSWTGHVETWRSWLRKWGHHGPPGPQDTACTPAIHAQCEVLPFLLQGSVGNSVAGHEALCLLHAWVTQPLVMPGRGPREWGSREVDSSQTGGPQAKAPLSVHTEGPRSAARRRGQGRHERPPRPSLRVGWGQAASTSCVPGLPSTKYLLPAL